MHLVYFFYQNVFNCMWERLLHYVDLNQLIEQSIKYWETSERGTADLVFPRE